MIINDMLFMNLEQIENLLLLFDYPFYYVKRF